MGRQKTLYIDEACWEKLEEMEGDSISHKVRKCIMQYDLDFELAIVVQQRRIAALKTQIESLKAVLVENKIDGWWID
jgi:hypothetical protein